MSTRDDRQRSRNRRTGFILLIIVLVFFFGVMTKTVVLK